MNLVPVIVLMAVVTYGLRAAGFALPTSRLAPFWRRWLDHVPIAVFAALIASSIPGSSPTDTGLRLAGLLVGAVLLLRRAPLWLVLAVALGLYLLARARLV